MMNDRPYSLVNWLTQATYSDTERALHGSRWRFCANMGFSTKIEFWQKVCTFLKITFTYGEDSILSSAGAVDF